MITLWSLYNSVDKLQIDDLKTEQVRIVLLSIPTARMKDWMICKKNDLHWQSLLQVPEFFEDVRDIKGDTTGLSPGDLNSNPSGKEKKSAPDSRRPLFEDFNMEDIKTLSVMAGDNHEVHERRNARRYVKSLKFEIIQGGKSFSTETVDVSMSGMSLKDALPTWVKPQFQATVSMGSRKLHLVVSRTTGGDSTKIRLVDVEQWETLKNWIVNW